MPGTVGRADAFTAEFAEKTEARNPFSREVAISIKLILCAADLEDENSVTIAAYAQNIAEMTRAPLVVVYVVESRETLDELHAISGIVGVETQKVVAAAEKTMQQFISENFTSVSATGRVAVGAAAREILGAARETNADLIVMGTRGKKGIERMLLGSVAANVVKDAAVPVLTIPIGVARRP